MRDIKYIVIDTFCGFGGVSHGVKKAKFKKQRFAKVVACVNHDPGAIQNHKLNHKNTLHILEDIKLVNIQALLDLVNSYRRMYPDVVLVFWAAPDCTHHSGAAGGGPKNADSRTLPRRLYRYIRILKPEYVYVENVKEFLSWGPLDKNGKIIKELKGRDYYKWREKIKSFGYNYDYRLINAADHGEHTSRVRYFGQFAMHGWPIAWPEATHSKKPEKNMFVDRKQWRPVREVLDLEDEGTSIFMKDSYPVENTLKRYFDGLVKFVAGGDKNYQERRQMLDKYFGKSSCKSIETPAGTLTTKDRYALITALHWMDKEYTGKYNYQSLDRPAGTVQTNDKHKLMEAKVFISKQYSSGQQNQSVEQPGGTITCVPKLEVVKVKTPFILDTNFNNTGRDLESPGPTIVACRKYHYLVNPQFSSKGSSVDAPCFTLIAKMDKRPPYITTVETGEPVIVIYEDDTPYTKKIKEFMAMYGLVDIKSRMLKVEELIQIQGFPADYKMVGSQTKKKKYIGNSVVPKVATRLTEANYQAIMEYLSKVKMAS